MQSEQMEISAGTSSTPAPDIQRQSHVCVFAADFAMHEIVYYVCTEADDGHLRFRHGEYYSVVPADCDVVIASLKRALN
jgi:hypothetical protein